MIKPLAIEIKKDSKRYRELVPILGLDNQENKLIEIEMIPVLAMHRDCESLKNVIIFRHGHIAIPNYKKGSNKEFEDLLSVYNDNTRRKESFGRYHMKRMRELRLSRSFNPAILKKYFPMHKPVLQNQYVYPHDKYKFELYAPPKDDLQLAILYQMLGVGKYEYIKKYTQQYITANPGVGKTYMAIAAQHIHACRALYVTSNIKILEQWLDSLTKFTSITEEEILIIDGSKTLDEIRRGEHKDKVAFLMVIHTFASYVSIYGDILAQQALYEMNCGIKVVDEAHKNTNMVAMLEGLSNFKMNYYLTATLGRNSDAENSIFKIIHYNAPKIGGDLVHKEDNHLRIMCLKYYFKPTQEDRKVFYVAGKFQSKLYEQRMVDIKQKSFRKVLIKVAYAFKSTRVNGGKMLLMMASVSGIDYAYDIMKFVFKDTLKIGKYHSKLSAKEKSEGLGSDIIIATSGGLGTGTDISDIQFCVNTESYSNGRVTSKQISNRARPNSKFETVYMELVNYGYFKTIKQFERHMPFLEAVSKSGKIEMIP